MKTIEEAARKYAISEICDSPDYADSFSDEVNACVKDFEAGVKFAEEWISVNEELPNDINGFVGQGVLVKLYARCCVAELDPRYGWCSFDEFISDREVTHWRPINRK